MDEIRTVGCSMQYFMSNPTSVLSFDLNYKLYHSGFNNQIVTFFSEIFFDCSKNAIIDSGISESFLTSVTSPFFFRNQFKWRGQASRMIYLGTVIAANDLSTVLKFKNYGSFIVKIIINTTWHALQSSL